MTRLFTLMGNHPHALPIKRGEIRSSVVELDFANEPQPHEAFKPFVRELKFDCGELAIGTFMQAITYGRPLVLLPVVVSSRFHQASINYNAARGHVAPKDIEGKTVATRIYAQTTGIWVRGLLRQQFGVDSSKVTWLTFDECHLPEYQDPPNCRRAAPGTDADAMLLAGEVEAIIPFSLERAAMKREDLKSLIPDPDKAARDWYAQTKAVPLNHLLVVQQKVIDRDPEAVRELYRMFVKAKRTLPPPANGIDMIPTGIEAIRNGLDIVTQYAFEQQIVPKRYTTDELFATAKELLGAEAE